jgi:hypothetical protein
MKKAILMAAIVCLANFSYAQSDKYVAAMKANIGQMDSLRTKNNGSDLANNFTRIGDAEKTLWLPYYYAAYCTVTSGLNEKDLSKKDALADKSNDLLGKAETILGKVNSETEVIKSLIATLRMTVDPQTRYMTYAPEISENIEKAKSLDPTNPRPYLLEGQNKFYTPEAFGGGKDVAKPIFDKAKQLSGTFKPESDIAPNWGKVSLDYFLSQYK